MLEYTAIRAQKLNKMNIPSIESNIGIKILWFDCVNSGDVSTRIYRGQHSHSFFEMHFIFSGKMTYDCHGKIYELDAGDAIIISPNVSHGLVSFSDDILKLSIAFSINEKANRIRISDNPVGFFVFSNDIVECVDYLFKIIERRDIFIPSIVGGRIFEIIYSALKSLQIEIPIFENDGTDPRVAVAKDFINGNKHRLISCEDVAKECCLSVKQTNRIFKKYTGSTLYDYIVSSRLKYAKKLLCENTYSIKEISYMIGFDSESSFISFFKRHCGTPPGAYRKQSSKCP